MLISTYGLTSIPDKHMRLLTRLYSIPRSIVLIINLGSGN